MRRLDYIIIFVLIFVVGVFVFFEIKGENVLLSPRGQQNAVLCGMTNPKSCSGGVCGKGDCVPFGSGSGSYCGCVKKGNTCGGDNFCVGVCPSGEVCTSVLNTPGNVAQCECIEVSQKVCGNSFPSCTGGGCPSGLKCGVAELGYCQCGVDLTQTCSSMPRENCEVGDAVCGENKVCALNPETNRCGCISTVLPSTKPA